MLVTISLATKQKERLNAQKLTSTRDEKGKAKVNITLARFILNDLSADSTSFNLIPSTSRPFKLVFILKIISLLHSFFRLFILKIGFY